MHKTLLIYPSFMIVFVLLAMIFITSTTYTQLGIAILLYPLLAFFAYKILPHNWKYVSKKPAPVDQPILQKVSPRFAKPVEKTEDTQIDNTGISDINKRTFLKLIGATGISFFLISIFGQKVQSLLFGQNLLQESASTGKTGLTAASPTDGYNISEIDDNIIGYFGFINKEGHWFIMKGDTDTGSYRYSRGKSNFPDNWKNRQNLDYNYFHQVFP